MHSQSPASARNIQHFAPTVLGKSDSAAQRVQAAFGLRAERAAEGFVWVAAGLAQQRPWAFLKDAGDAGPNLGSDRHALRQALLLEFEGVDVWIWLNMVSQELQTERRVHRRSAPVEEIDLHLGDEAITSTSLEDAAACLIVVLQSVAQPFDLLSDPNSL